MSGKKRGRPKLTLTLEERKKRRLEQNAPSQWKYRIEKFGVSKEMYEKMFAEQHGRCSICGTHQSELKRKLSIDHDHKTLIVRGLLCDKCNHAIGLFGDDITTLARAIEYLSKQ